MFSSLIPYGAFTPREVERARHEVHILTVLDGQAVSFAILDIEKNANISDLRGRLRSNVEGNPFHFAQKHIPGADANIASTRANWLVPATASAP